jgi:hypothetical protein
MHVNVRTSVVDKILVFSAVQLLYDYNHRKRRVRMKINNNNNNNQITKYNQIITKSKLAWSLSGSCTTVYGETMVHSQRKSVFAHHSRASANVTECVQCVRILQPFHPRSLLAGPTPNMCLVLYMLILVSEYKRNVSSNRLSVTCSSDYFSRRIAYSWLLCETFSIRSEIFY